MIYPENIKNIPLIVNWINASLSRAITQKQEPYMDFINIKNPCLIDPYQLDPENYAIELPDGYIIPMFSGNDEYQTSIERSQMASEGVTNLNYALVGINYKSYQDDVQAALNLTRFFQTLYTWGTDLLWVDKVHPQDIVGNILFKGTVPTYATRVPNTGTISPDHFLQNGSTYDFSSWNTLLSTYGSLDQNTFIWGNDQPTFYYPGAGFQWTTQDRIQKLDILTGVITQMTNSYLLNQLGTNADNFLTQNWEARVAILSAAAVNYTPYFSYLIRK